MTRDMDLARQLLFAIESMEWEGCENLELSFLSGTSITCSITSNSLPKRG